MLLQKLSLKNFRNYEDVTVEFNQGGNLLFGDNGEGKTNFLESIYYLSVFRSFKKGSNSEIARWETDGFHVSGFFETGSAITRSIDVTWKIGKKKRVFFEGERIPKISGLIGMFPAVIMSPESQEISQGMPRERRRFLDICISMVDSEYLQNLMAYKRVIRQRNKFLLLSVMGRQKYLAALEPWDIKLVQHGTFLIKRRLEAIDKLSAACREMYAKISGGREELTVEYQSTIPDLNRIEESFRTQLLCSRDDEKRRKTTLAGPHRDDIKFCLNGYNARKFASQGQHKTILLALKSAELKYISEHKDIQPVILLDDLFALLDRTRILAFLNILRSYSQFFITANSEIKPEMLLSKAGFKVSDFTQYFVKGGQIKKN